MSLFGPSGAATQTQNSGSLFGNSAGAQPQQQTSLFGNTAATTSATTGGLFGTTASKPQTTSLFGAVPTSQPAPSNSLFGNTNAQPAPSNSLFGNTTSQPAQSGGLFGKTAPAPGTSSLFGASTTANQNAQPTKSLFSGFVGAAAAPQEQTIPPANPDVSTYMMDSRRIWNEEDGAPRSRTVMEQLQMVNKKWDPSHPQHSFQTYLYNQVEPNAAPFYRPSPGENEEAWEEALRNAPSAGSIPFRVRGFYELGMRIISQQRHLEILSGRLHEINNGLSALLRKHELDITSRAAAARRRHAALSQRVLTLATKTIVARNRGYQLDPAEEQLKKRLGELERAVTDPGITGREEEIWARMVQVREQGRRLETELERAGLGRNNDRPQDLSEEVVKSAEKVLKDYDQQLMTLTKELEKIKKDWQGWEQSRSATNGDARR